MNTINDEFDVVIKIKKLDDYRLRPLKTATTQEPIAAKNSVSSSIHSLDLGDIEKMIYAVIENTNIGIKAKDIVIDALTMTMSTDDKSADITLETVREIARRGGRTVLGVSNISFGLYNIEFLGFLLNLKIAVLYILSSLLQYSTLKSFCHKAEYSCKVAPSI